MQIRQLLLVITLTFFITGCYDIDLLNVELKEDLSSSVTFIVSPPTSEEIRNQQGWSQENKDNFFKTIEQEFGKCGFKVQKNFRYDADGASGIQNFSSVAELEQAINCIGITGFQSSPIQIKSPTKTEGLLQNTYTLQIDLRSPYLVAESALQLALQPLKELRISMPGEIASASIRNPSLTLLVDKLSAASQAASFRVQRINLEGNALKEYFKKLDFDPSGIDLDNFEEVKAAFREQTGVDANNHNEMQKYIDSKIPPYTSISVISKKPKVDIGIIVTIVIGILTIIATILPSFINKK